MRTGCTNENRVHCTPFRMRCPALSGVIFFWPAADLSKSSSPWKPPAARCLRSFVISEIWSFLLFIRSFCFSACTCFEYCFSSRFFRLHQCCNTVK